MLAGAWPLEAGGFARDVGFLIHQVLLRLVFEI